MELMAPVRPKAMGFLQLKVAISPRLAGVGRKNALDRSAGGSTLEDRV